MTAGRPAPGRRELAIAGALPPIAAAAAAVLYDDPLLMLLTVAAAGAAGAAPVGLARGRFGLAGPVAVSALAGTLFVIILTTGTGTGTTVGQLGGSLAHLLSFALPVPIRPDTLAPPVVIVWTASFLAASIATRGRRLLSAAPSAAVLVGALLLVGTSAPVPGWVAPGVGVGVVALVLASPGGTGVRSGHRRTQPSRRTGARLTGAVTAVSLVAAGLFAAQAVPDTGRLDLRAEFQPPLEQLQPIDPLTRLAAWAKGDRTPLANLTIDTGTSGEQAPRAAWRWAILDRFDGARWASSTRYRPTGGRLRSSEDVGNSAGNSAGNADGSSPSRLVRASVQVSPTLAPWLPAPGTVLRVRGTGIQVNAEHDSLESPSPGVAYSLVAGTTLDAENPDDRTRIAGLAAGVPGDAMAALAVPRLPEQLRQIAIAFEPAADTTDGARALGLQDLLRNNGQFASDAPAGHLYLRLTQFFDEGSPAYLRGTSEQFATAFAVLARAVRLPTRVVVGFESSAGEPEQTTITGADMVAWPEVYFAGQGWVRFDPTPPTPGTGAPHRPRKLDQLLPQPQQQAARPRPRPRATPGDRSGETPRQQRTATPAVLAVVVSLVLVGAAVVGLVAVVVLRRRLTTRRRRERDPTRRTLGAWRELEDALALVGVRATAVAATDLATRVDERLRPAQRHGTALAGLANAAAFGPPGEVTSAQAEQAWSISDQAVAELRRSAVLGRRCTWWVRPGPILPGRRPGQGPDGPPSERKGAGARG
jgi:transglutaminase-like putative cysteine protease